MVDFCKHGNENSGPKKEEEEEEEEEEGCFDQVNNVDLLKVSAPWH
jgi:hypothetical protein